MKLEVDLIVSLAQGDAPGRRQQMFAPLCLFSSPEIAVRKAALGFGKGW
jgi:hypothetical protein